MKQLKHLLRLSVLAISILCVGCDMIEYHPYDLDIDGEKDLNNKNIQEIEYSLQAKKTDSICCHQ